MRSGGTLVLVALLQLWSIAGRAAAAPPTRSRVAIVHTSGSDRLLREASTRLRAELVQAGFDVTEVERAPGGPRAEVESASQQTQSFATVAIDRAGSGAFADVWISDLVTGKTVVRRLSVGPESNAAAVLAIRALELLRASLLEVASPLGSSSNEPTPSDVLEWVEPALPDKPQRAGSPFAGPSVSFGVLGLHSFDGIGPAVGPVARVAHGIGGRAFGRFSLAAPVFAPSVSAPEGSASIQQLALSLDLGWASDAQPMGAYAWAGLGASYLHTSGSAEPPYHSTSDGILSLLATAGLGGLVRLSRTVAFSTEVAAFGLVPQPVVVIADRDVGKAGSPSIGVAAGVSVAL